MQTLLAAGAEPTQYNNNTYSTLHYAARLQDSQSVIKVLVAADVLTNERDSLEATSLSWSAVQNHSISAEALLDYSANINALNNEGDSALHNAVHYHSDDVMKLLLSRGAHYTSSQQVADRTRRKSQVKRA